MRSSNDKSPVTRDVDPASFQGIIFDLDGTLLDTLEDIADAANRSLEGHGFPAHRLEAYRGFVGDGAWELIVRALPNDRRNAATIASCVEAFRRHYRNGRHRYTKPYEGTEALLETLATMGVLMAVLSNKPHDLTVSCVKSVLHRYPLEPVLGQADGRPRKPDPGGARDIISRFGLEPERVLFLGDSGVDMRTAVNAAAYPVGALWGFRSAEELSRSGARTLIRHPTDLLNAFWPECPVKTASRFVP